MAENEAQQSFLDRFLEKPKGVGLFKVGGDEDVSRNLFNFIASDSIGPNASIEEKVKLAGHMPHVMEWLKENNPDVLQSTYDGTITIGEAMDVYNPRHVLNTIEEENKEEYKKAYSNFRNNQLNDKGLFKLGEGIVNPQAQKYIDEKTGDYRRGMQDLQDTAKVVVKGALSVPALPADLTDLASMGLDWAIGEDRADWVEKGLSYTVGKVLDPVFDVSRAAQQLRDDDILAYKGQLSVKPRLAATVDFFATLSPYSKLEKGIKMSNIKRAVNVKGVKSSDSIGVPKEVFTQIDEAIAAAKPNVIGKIKERILKSKQAKLQKFSVHGEKRFRQMLDKEHHLMNASLAATYGTGQFFWGGPDREGFFNFNENPILQVGMLLAGAVFMPQVLNKMYTGTSDLGRTLKTLANPQATKRTVLKDKYGYSDEQLESLQESEINALYETSPLQDKATAELVERFEFNRQFRPDLYRRDVGIAKSLSDTHERVKDMAYQMYKDGKSGIDNATALAQAELRAENLLMSDVLAGYSNATKRIDSIPLSGKLPKELDLTSDIQKQIDIEANVRQMEVDSLNFLLPTEGGSRTKTLGTTDDLLTDVRLHHEKKLTEIDDKRTELIRKLSEKEFKNKTESMARSDYYEGTIDKLDDVDLEETYSVDQLKKTFLRESKLANPKDIAGDSRELIIGLKERQAQKFNRLYNGIRATFAKTRINLQDDSVSASFAKIKDRSGKTYKSAGDITPRENLAESTQMGLETAEGIAATGRPTLKRTDVNKIYIDAQKNLIYDLAAMEDVSTLRTMYKKLYDDFGDEIGEIDAAYMTFPPNKLATEIDALIQRGYGTDGVISLDNLHYWKSTTRDAAGEASSLEKRTLAKNLYETYNDLQDIMSAVTKPAVTKLADDTMQGLTESQRFVPVSQADIEDAIITYQKADAEYFTDVVEPFQMGQARTMTRKDPGGEYTTAPENWFGTFIDEAPISARQSWDNIFKNATPEEAAKGVDLLEESIKNNIRNNKHIPEDFLNNFEDKLGTEFVSNVRKAQDGYDELYYKNLSEKAKARFERDLAEQTAELSAETAILDNLRKQLKTQDPAEAYEVIKKFTPEKLEMLVDDIVKVRQGRKDLLESRYNDQILKKEIKAELLHALSDGIKADIVKYQDAIGGIYSKSQEGFENFLKGDIARKSGRITDDMTENYFYYLEEIDGKAAQAVIVEMENVLNVLAPKDTVKNLKEVFGQTKTRGLVESYKTTAGGVPSPLNDAYLFGRSYNAVKGHLSWRYLFTETLLKVMRRKRVDLIQQMIADPTITKRLMQSLYTGDLNPKSIKTTTHVIRSLYALPQDVTDDEIKDGIQEEVRKRLLDARNRKTNNEE